ncbi:MAG: hypothetical protein IPI87_04370 [Betaproteobacteria bacterium]|nr:hypothetical protein [Betaproteobacteria bacterium]
MLDPRRVAAQFGQEIRVGRVLAGGAARFLRLVEPRELREVDGARIRQPGDDLLREEELHLLRRELAAETAQKLAGVVRAQAADRDGRQHVAVVLGDRQVQAQVGRDEAFEFLADGGDQRAIGPEVFQPGRGAAGSRATRHRLARPVADVPGGVRRHVARRQVRTREDPVHPAQHPVLERHA